jgi:hypothetical protein
LRGQHRPTRTSRPLPVTNLFLACHLGFIHSRFCGVAHSLSTIDPRLFASAIQQQHIPITSMDRRNASYRIAQRTCFAHDSTSLVVVPVILLQNVTAFRQRFTACQTTAEYTAHPSAQLPFMCCALTHDVHVHNHGTSTPKTPNSPSQTGHHTTTKQEPPTWALAGIKSTSAKKPFLVR